MGRLWTPTFIFFTPLLGLACPEPGLAGEKQFIRGDSNADGRIDVSDAYHIGLQLFVIGASVPCEKAVDANDDGMLDVTDIIFLLTFLFRDGAEPPGPFPVCGFDETSDSLTCADYPACGPLLSDLRITDVTNRSAVVRWRTSLPGTSRVDYGVGGELGLTATSSVYETEHAVALNDLAPGTQYVFRASSVIAGETRVSSKMRSFRTRAGIVVTNLTDGETLRYDLALLSGHVDTDVTSLGVTVGSDHRTWSVVARRFKVLVPLSRGENRIVLETEDSSRVLHVHYEPQTNPHFVRIVYLLPRDGDGSFDAPPGEPNDVQSAVARLRLAGRLMQTFTAEKLHAQGLGRRTFRLQRAADGEPVVELVRSDLTMDRSHAMDGGELWSHVWGELASLPRRTLTKDLVVMGMTRYDASTGLPLAHTALGADRLALFGSGGLHTWAQSLDELEERFTDTRLIDTTRLFDDSNQRGTHWANYATGVGASLHELGHCLGLPHTPTGIMSRDLDYFQRAFMITEPPSRRTPGLAPVLVNEEPGWHPDSAFILWSHPWLALDGGRSDGHQAD